jgi:hypothetical protein
MRPIIVYVPVPENPFDAEKLRRKGEKVHSLIGGYIRSSKKDPATDESQRDRLKAIQQQIRWELDRRFPPPGTPTGSLIDLF